MLAGKLKGTYRISLADAYIAALCQHLDCALVHKDPEFETISVIKQIVLLRKG